MSGNWDARFLFELNSLIPTDPLGARIFSFLGNNDLFRGFPVFFPLVALWFSTDRKDRRSRMLVGLFATCVATVTSLWLQNHLPFHTRPFLDPALHLHGIDPKYVGNWDHLGSFPSDTATLFFALSTIIVLENRVAGGIAFIWSLVAVGLFRAALGWHYPSDVAGSLILGPSAVYLFTRIRFLGTAFDRVLDFFEPRLHILHALLFIFLADAYALFRGLRGFLNGFVILFGHILRR
jgi:membrane-associated phospholipid phosphatase